MQYTRYKIDISNEGVWSISDEVLEFWLEDDQDDRRAIPKDKISQYNYILMLQYIFGYKRGFKDNETFVCGIYMVCFFKILFYNTQIKTKLTNPEKFYNYTKRWIQEHEDHIQRMENEGIKSFSVLDSLSISFGRHLKEIVRPTETTT